MLIDDNVAAEVAKLSDLKATRGQAQQLLSVWNDDVRQRHPCIWMRFDNTIELNRCDALTRTDIDPDADGTLMEVGFTVGRSRGQTQHAHYWITFEYDQANVGNTFVTDVLKYWGHAN